MQKITESRSKNKGLKIDLTVILMRLGEVKSKQEKFQDALADFGQAVKIHQDILQNFAGDNRTYGNLARTYKSIAETHEKISGEKDAAARENYQKCLDILVQLESQNALSEFDRKFLEKMKNVVQKYQ